MSKAYTPRTLAEVALRVVQDIPDGVYVNLGIGRPMAISNHLPSDKEFILHCENGLLGMGHLATGDEIDPEIRNAGKQPVTLLKGASISHSGDAFMMMRGGHIDYCVLGAYQVSMGGDLANWRTLDRDDIPAVGGAMDLAHGARHVYIMMDHTTKKGESKLVRECTYPLTAIGVVDRIYTDLASLQVTPKGLLVLDRVDGLSHAELESISQLELLETI